MSIEAMKQALEALEVMKAGHCAEEKIYISNAIAALRQAIEQAEKQEPVAWWNPTTDNASTDPYYRNSKECIPLYTAPPRKEWVGLTDEEVHEAAIKCVKSGQSVNAAIHAIEAKLKEKNT
jgi:hypothetical protein